MKKKESSVKLNNTKITLKAKLNKRILINDFSTKPFLVIDNKIINFDINKDV